MKKRLFTLLLTLVLIVTCVTPITASAARITQEYAVTNLLRWARFTQADADAEGGWIDLANPEADFLSRTATGTEDSTIDKYTYNIYLQPNLYTVKAGHKLALVICTRDPSMGGYKNSNAGYTVLISDVKATIPVY